MTCAFLTLSFSTEVWGCGENDTLDILIATSNMMTFVSLVGVFLLPASMKR
jgi:hypothetical protein